jgi:hypothetical protein
MTTTWTVRDRVGHRVPGYDGHSRSEVGRKLVPSRFDAFRLEVSLSYRELFERAVAQILRRKGWEIVRCEPMSQADQPATPCVDTR